MHRKFSSVAGTPTNKTVRRTSYGKTKENKQAHIKTKTQAKKANLNECLTRD